LFSPSLESRFSQCEARIKSQTEHLDREVATAGLEWTQKRDEEARERDEDAKRVVQKTGENIMKLIQETAPPTSVPATTFPFRFVQHCPRNNTFFGREDYMSILDSRLGITGTIDASYMRSIVIHGLGGCGKSSIAKEYMYRHYDSGKYEVILWMYADSIGKLGTQFIHIARQLKIKTNESDARDAVLHWINNLGKFVTC
jgi:hypothetical protein